jgi:hypothetical protein
MDDSFVFLEEPPDNFSGVDVVVLVSQDERAVRDIAPWK